ncbi:MAG: hypothetical protein Q8P67_22845 [archaeon]|nr:hypothetical protein [archaeon]
MLGPSHEGPVRWQGVTPEGDEVACDFTCCDTLSLPPPEKLPSDDSRRLADSGTDDSDVASFTPDEWAAGSLIDVGANASDGDDAEGPMSDSFFAGLIILLPVVLELTPVSTICSVMTF